MCTEFSCVCMQTSGVLQPWGGSNKGKMAAAVAESQCGA